MEKINYRSAELKDLEVLYSFEQGIVTTERPFDPTLKPGHINYYDLKHFIESEDAELIIAEVNDEIVGSGYARFQKAKPYLKFEYYAHVGFIYVKPEHRRKGISQMVIEHLKAWAKAKKLDEMRLTVYDENHAAIAAYEKLGMKKHIIEMRIEL